MSGPITPLRLTIAEIHAAKTRKGGWTKETLAVWGVPWPPPKGWRAALVAGKPIPSPQPVGTISASQVVEKLIGGTRSDAQIAKDGARAVIGQIDKLRYQLDQAERSAQYTLRTGTTLKSDDAIWKRVGRAAATLLEGMTE